jgi:hypothetical protein
MVVVSVTVYSSEISVKLSGGIEKISSFREQRISYFSMSQLAEILGESITWDIVGISAVLETEKNRMTFFINSPYININDTVKNLIYPVKMIKGSLHYMGRRPRHNQN